MLTSAAASTPPLASLARPRKAAASSQWYIQCVLLPPGEPHVRVASSSSTWAGLPGARRLPTSVNSAPNFRAADPSAMHDGQSRSLSWSAASTGPT